MDNGYSISAAQASDIYNRLEFISSDKTRLIGEWINDSKQLLAACISNPALLDDAYMVTAEHMPNEHFGAAWDALLQASANGAVDLRSVMDRMPEKYSPSFRHSLMVDLAVTEAVPLPSMMQEYVARVLNAKRRATNLGVSIQLIHESLRSHDSESLTLAENNVIETLVGNSGEHNQAVWLSEIADDILDELEYNIENPADIRGLETGLTDLDRALGGLERHNYVIVGARPSMGKSTLVFEMAKRWARSGRPGMMLTTETSRRMLLIRMACSEARINYQREFKTGKLLHGGRERWDRLREVVNELARLPILHLPATHTPSSLYALAHRMKRVHGIEWFVVDTLNLVPNESGSRDDERISITRKSARLAQIAHELEILTVVTWQLNRNVEQRSDKVPIMSDLRESGAGEEHGDAILFLYRAEYYRRMGMQCKEKLAGERIGENEVDIIIAKNRDGAPSRWVRLYFDQQYARIGNLCQES